MLHDLSLKGLRQSAYDYRSTTSSGQTQDDRVNRAINEALQDLVGDVPEALQPETHHVVLRPDIVGTDSAVMARAGITTDARVMKLTDPDGTVSSTWTPDVDGTWDGLMHLEVKDAAGRWYRRQCLEFWLLPADGHYYVTIDRPWHNVTDTLMEFRLYQPRFYLPSNVIQIGDGTLWDSSHRTVKHIDQGSLTRWGLSDYQGDTKGPPEKFFRREHKQLQAPSRPPVITDHPSTNWAGPAPKGQFVVYYTIVHGRLGNEHQVSPGGIADPIFESAPSPPSAPFNSTAINALIITTMNIDAMMDFAVSGTLREARSGFRIRIYVERWDISTKATFDPNYAYIGTNKVPYLLAEIEPSALVGLAAASYVWDGSVIPDYHRRMPSSVGHYAYQTYPQQDARYEVDFPVLCTPPPLLHDQDTPSIRPEARAMFKKLVLSWVALQDGNDVEGSLVHRKEYEKKLRKFRSRYANAGGVVTPVPYGVDPSAGQRVSRYTDES